MNESRGSRAARLALKLGAEGESFDSARFWEANVRAWIAVFGRDEVVAGVKALGQGAPSELREAMARRPS